MADIVIDAAAAPPTLNQALEFVRSKGTVGLVGSAEDPAPCRVDLITHKDIRVIGIVGSVIGAGIDLLAGGRIQTDPLISHHFSLDDAADAFRVAADPSSLKVMIHPGTAAASRRSSGRDPSRGAGRT